MLIEFIKFFIFSILIVLISKYMLVKVLRNVGEILNLKPKIIGNISGIATSIPELLTVSFSAFAGLIETSTFNILSSNVINLVQYLISIIVNKNQSKIGNNAIRVDLMLVIITIIIPIILIISKIEENFLMVPFFLILFYIFYKLSKNAHKVYLKHEEEEKVKDVVRGGLILNILGIILAGVLLYYVGDLLSGSLEILCMTLNVPEIILGILLGIITSIPEFITFYESQKHHNNSNEGIVEATSNLLFSNLLNIFVIQSLGIVIFLLFS